MEKVNQPVSPLALKQGYEPEGLSVKWLLLCVYLLMMTALVIHVGLWVLLRYLVTTPVEADAPLTGISPAVAVQHFNDPRLQPMVGHDKVPWQDLDQTHAKADATFEAMGWKIDPATGTPIIPAAIITQLSGQPAPGPGVAHFGQPATELRLHTPGPSLAEEHATPLVATTEPARSLEEGK